MKKENIKTRLSEPHEVIDIKTEVKDEGRSRPKRPMFSYQAFIKQNSAKIMKDNRLGVGGSAKILGEQWKNLTSKQKEPYIKIAEQNPKTPYI